MADNLYYTSPDAAPTYIIRTHYQVRAMPVLTPAMAKETVHVQWFMPLSEPLRGPDNQFVTTRRDDAKAHRQPAPSFWVPQQPASEQVTESRWHQAWSTPSVQALLSLRPASQLATVLGQPPPPNPPSVDAWLIPYAEPVRVRPPLLAQQQAAAFTGASPFLERVTEDRWHMPWSEPVRVPQRLHPALQPPSPFVVAREVFIGAATQYASVEWRGPTFKRVVQYQQLAYGTYVTPAPAPPAPALFHDKWVDPVQHRIPWTVSEVKINFPRPDEITLDRWFVPWGMPVRVRAAVPVGQQQFLAFVQGGPFGPDVPSAAFTSTWQLPTRKPMPLSLHQISNAATSFFINQVRVDSWMQPLTRPIWVRRPQQTGFQGSGQPPQIFPEPTGVDQYLSGWSIPVGPVVKVVHSTTQIPRVIPPEGEVTLDKWFAPLSRPVLVPRRLREGLNQTTARTGASPFAEPTSIDRWLASLSLPSQLAKPGLRSQQQQAIAFTPNFSIPTTLYPPLAEPARPRQLPLLPGLMQTTARTGASPFIEAPTVDRWLMPYALPIRLPVGTRSSMQVPFFEVGRETVFSDKWFRPLSEPVRIKPALQTGLARDLAFALFATKESVSVDRWLIPLALPPVMTKPILRPGLMQTTARTGAAPFAEILTQEAKWHFPWSTPRRAPRLLIPAAQAFFSMQPQQPTAFTAVMHASDNADTAEFEIGFHRTTTNPPSSAIVTISEITPEGGVTSIAEQ